jgi:hypothetical protein
MGMTKKEPRLPDVKLMWAHKFEMSSTRDLVKENRKTSRANVYATPTHSPSTTKVHSVSFPV